MEISGEQDIRNLKGAQAKGEKGDKAESAAEGEADLG